MVFTERMVPEVIQPFWVALSRGEFITGAAESVGTYRVKGKRWLAATGGVPYGSGRAATSQLLPLAGGGETPALSVSTEIPRVGLRTPALRWVSFRIEPGMIEIAVRVLAESDDVRDDVDEVTLDDVVRVRSSG